MMRRTQRRPPPAHQRAAGRAAAAQAHGAGPNKEAEVGANRLAIKEAKAGANRRAIKGGAGGQPTGPHGKEEVVEAQGHRAPYGVEEATRARGGEESESEDDRGRDKPAHGAATTMKTHRKAHAGGGGAEPSSVAGVVWRPSVAAPTGEKTQGRERGGSAADFSQAPKRRRSCLARRETEPPRKPTARPMPAGGSGAPKGRVRRRCPQGQRQGNGLRRDARARDNVGPTHGRQRSGSGCVDDDAKEEDGASPR